MGSAQNTAISALKTALAKQRFPGGSLTEAEANATYAPARKVSAPAGFGTFSRLTMPKIYRAGGGTFHTDFDVQALRPPAGVTYYVAPGASGDGTSAATPAKMSTVYAKPDVGTIIYAPGEYRRESSSVSALTKSINHIAAAPGVKVTGWNANLNWTLTTGAIYQTARSLIVQVVDTVNLTAWGDYTTYTKMGTTSASITGPGQWATDGTTVWVRALGDVNLSSNVGMLRMQVGGLTCGVLGNAGTTQYVQGVDFEGCPGGGLAATGDGALLIAVDCSVKYSQQAGGLNIDKGASAVVVRTLASSNELDGFNYHNTAAGTSCDFLEIDCRSHHNGLAAPGTNNASTSHDNCKGIRVNGVYDVSGGPVVADVNSAKTWNLGCRAGATQGSTGGGSWRVDGTSYTTTPAEQWLDTCTADTAPVAYRATAAAKIHVYASRYTNASTTYPGDDGFVDFYTP